MLDHREKDLLRILEDAGADVHSDRYDHETAEGVVITMEPIGENPHVMISFDHWAHCSCSLADEPEIRRGLWEATEHALGLYPFDEGPGRYV